MTVGISRLLCYYLCNGDDASVIHGKNNARNVRKVFVWAWKVFGGWVMKIERLANRSTHWPVG